MPILMVQQRRHYRVAVWVSVFRGMKRRYIVALLEESDSKVAKFTSEGQRVESP